MKAKKAKEEKKTKVEVKDDDTTQLLVWGIPIELKAEFKAKCAVKQISMGDAIIQLLKDFNSK